MSSETLNKLMAIEKYTPPWQLKKPQLDYQLADIINKQFTKEKNKRQSHQSHTTNVLKQKTKTYLHILFQGADNKLGTGDTVHVEKKRKISIFQFKKQCVKFPVEMIVVLNMLCDNSQEAES